MDYLEIFEKNKTSLISARRIIFIDLVIHNDIRQIILAMKYYNKDCLINLLVSKEWFDRLKNSKFINTIFYYNVRGSITSLLNLKLIFQNLFKKYDLIIINCDDDLIFLRYFILNIVFLRKKEVYFLNSYFKRANFFQLLIIFMKFLIWTVGLIFEFIISSILLAYLYIINRCHRLKVLFSKIKLSITS